MTSAYLSELNHTWYKGREVYVNKTGSDGWLQVEAHAHRQLSLCKYTKLKVIESKAGRTYFKIQDGSHSGMTVSLRDSNLEEYLGMVFPRHGAVELVVTYGKYEEHWYSKARDREFKQQMASLSYGRGNSINVTMNSVWDSPKKYTPLPAGTYNILLPDNPHDKDMTRYYRGVEPNLKYDQVWFPIRYGDNSRYIHVGNVSEGCVTVLDLEKWVDLYEALISHRSSDGYSVGKLIVKGKPEKEK